MVNDVKNQNSTKVFTFPFSLQGRKVRPRPLKDGFSTLPPFLLGSASLSPPSCLLPAPASASASLPCSSTLLQLLQLPGHHHSCHHRLVPLCLAVHRDLGCAPVDMIRFAAQSCQGFVVNFFKFEFKCVFVTFMLRMVNCKVFCKCIVFILVTYCVPMLMGSTITRIT